MPLMQIHRNPESAKLIRMGHAPEVIQPEPKDVGESIEDLSASLMTFQQSIEHAVIDQPPVLEPEKNKRGRLRKMGEEKKLGHETGVEKIKEEDAGTQGAVGSGGVNAPAQDKVPEKPQGSDKEEG